MTEGLMWGRHRCATDQGYTRASLLYVTRRVYARVRTHTRASLGRIIHYRNAPRVTAKVLATAIELFSERYREDSKDRVRNEKRTNVRLDILERLQLLHLYAHSSPSVLITKNTKTRKSKLSLL